MPRRSFPNSFRSRSGRPLRFEPLESRSLLSTISVTTPMDVTDPGDGLTSLREAIIQANAAPEHDTITFDLGPGPHTINLASFAPAIRADLEIEGPGADLLSIRQSANGFLRPFTISQEATVRLSGITITGCAEGAIENAGTLTVNNCTISGNGLSYIDIYGAGIYNAGTLIVNDSTISGNSTAFQGGGIFSYGPITVTDSTISDNFGGGIVLDNLSGENSW